MFSKKQLTGIIAAAMLSAPVIEAQTLQVNFRDTDIKEVIGFVSSVTGKTIVVDPLVNGRVMVISEEALSPDELYDLFLSVLEVHNFVAVETNGIVRIVPKSETRSSAVAFLDGDVPSNSALVTQIIPVVNVSASQLLPVLRPMVPPESHLAAYEPSNSIVITDTAANVNRIKALVENFDSAAIPSSEVIDLEFANAETMASLVRDTLVGESPTQGIKIANVVADTRANRILVTGEPMARERVRKLVESLDTEVMAESSSRVIYLEYALAADIEAALNALPLSQGEGGANAQVKADSISNAIIITGDPTQIATLASIADQLDVEREQILVEAIIVELQETAGKELGVQWLFADSDSGTFGSSALTGSSANVGAVLGGAFDENGDVSVSGLGAGLSSVNGQTIGIAGVSGSINFSVLLNALEEVNGANILSTPSVLTLDNHEAEINVGQEVPFITGSYTSQGTGSDPDNPFQTVEREDVGVKLTVTPRVSGNGRIMLEIVQEVSSISGNTTVQATDVITNERRITTQVVADDGEMIVLGGLIQDDLQQYEQKVPLLGDIPWLGRLFRSNSNKLIKTNLLVFIRATSLSTSERVNAATAAKYRYIREQQGAMPEADPAFSGDIEKPELPEVLPSVLEASE